MRKIMALVLVGLFICSVGFCEKIDYASMTTEELIKNKKEIQEELKQRPDYPKNILYDGYYGVLDSAETFNEDLFGTLTISMYIPSGIYLITGYESTGDLTLAESDENGKFKRIADAYVYTNTTTYMELKHGQVFRVKGAVSLEEAEYNTFLIHP